VESAEEEAAVAESTDKEAAKEEAAN